MSSLYSLVSNTLVNLDTEPTESICYSVINRVNNCINSERGKLPQKKTTEKIGNTTASYSASRGALIRFSKQIGEQFEGAASENPALALHAVLCWIAKGQKDKILSTNFEPEASILKPFIAEWLKDICQRIIKEQTPTKLTPNEVKEILKEPAQEIVTVEVPSGLLPDSTQEIVQVAQ